MKKHFAKFEISVYIEWTGSMNSNVIHSWNKFYFSQTKQKESGMEFNVSDLILILKRASLNLMDEIFLWITNNTLQIDLLEYNRIELNFITIL